MASIEPSSGNRIAVSLEDQEIPVLLQLVDDMLALLEARPTDDPVLGRLFPDAYEDPEDARAFHELTDDPLAAAKIDALTGIRTRLTDETAASFELGPDEAEDWLRALTDIRLAIGERVGVDEERMSTGPDPDDPEAPALAILGWLGWVQESILRAMRREESA